MNARVLCCKNLTSLLDIACSIKTHTIDMNTCRVELLDPWFMIWHSSSRLPQDVWYLEKKDKEQNNNDKNKTRVRKGL
jgi:hypothetical protein